MQNDKLVGYVRIDSEEDAAVLECWVTRLLEIGVREVFTDLGPLTDGLEGLKNAVGCLSVNDVLIYPEVCLQELTIGDIPDVFGHIPDGTALKYFEPVLMRGQNGGVEITSIKLVDAADEDAEG